MIEKKVKLFTVPFDAAGGAFDDTALNAFLEGVQLFHMEQYFYPHPTQPWMVMVLQYGVPAKGSVAGSAGPVAAAATRGGREKAGPEELAARLGPALFGRYEALRHWRNSRAKVDGLRPFLLFSNEELVAIARLPPGAPIDSVAGVGDGKNQLYGDDIRKVLATLDQAGPVGEPPVAVGASAEAP